MTDQNTCSRCGGPVHRDYCVNPHCRIAELEDQVEALTAQLEEEERMVRRLREVVLGAPQSLAKVESPDGEFLETVLVALVRLDAKGLGLAGEVGNKEGADA